MGGRRQRRRPPAKRARTSTGAPSPLAGGYAGWHPDTAARAAGGSGGGEAVPRLPGRGHAGGYLRGGVCTAVPLPWQCASTWD